MTFEELRENDKEQAFFEWVSVTVAKRAGDIPQKYWSYFEDTCECGSDNIIKNNLKAMSCCDPKCFIKQGYAIAELLTRFGVKGLKEATCRKIYTEFKRQDQKLKESGKEGLLISDSYVAAIAVPWDRYPDEIARTVAGSDFYHACLEIVTKPVTFPKLVSKLAIPSIGSSADRLVSGIRNFDELFQTIKDEGGVAAFCSRRGFYSNLVHYNFRISLFDIATADRIFKRAVKPEGCLKLNVCMTGMIYLNGTRLTKEKYLAQCNKLCFVDNIQLVELNMTSAKETNPFILYSRESGDAKFVAGRARGVTEDDLFGQHPVLMHTDLFYKFLEKVVSTWNNGRATMKLEDLLMTFPTILKTSMQQVLSAVEAPMETREAQQMRTF
jgi:hypothetical protein